MVKPYTHISISELIERLQFEILRKEFGKEGHPREESKNKNVPHPYKAQIPL